MSTGVGDSGELIGRVLGGRYRVTTMVGRGGMGVVARAVDELLNREVAVKVLRAYTDASPAELADLRARMQREAQAAARVRHHGVVTVHDVTEDQGLPVIVMELVDGPSLDDVLAERGALDPREAAAIGAELMDALDAAHRAGVLHRDVKPGNVLMERGGRVVLTDFGIASMDATGDEAMTKLTRSGEIVGSLDYLPPERAQGREPGPASDIWSLGMTLYAAVEGTSPFRRTSVWSTLSAIVSEPLPEPRRAGPLTPVLLALMAKEPEARPTAGQARALLEQVAAGGGWTPTTANAAPVQPVPAPAPAPVHQPPAPVAPTPAAPTPGFGPPPPPAATGGAPFPHPYAPYGHQPPTVAQQQHAGPAAAPRRARTRTRTVLAAAAAVVLLAGGAAYAVMGKGGGKDHDRAAGAAGAAATGAVSPSAEGPTGTTPGPSPAGTAPATPKPRKASASASKDTEDTKPTPVSTACGGWSHRDPSPGTYGYMSGDFHLQTAPYQNCPSVSLAKTGTKLWYHCYTVNAHGNKWTYVRVEGTNTAGWMSNDNLTRQKGPSTPC